MHGTDLCLYVTALNCEWVTERNCKQNGQAIRNKIVPYR